MHQPKTFSMGAGSGLCRWLRATASRFALDHSLVDFHTHLHKRITAEDLVRRMAEVLVTRMVLMPLYYGDTPGGPSMMARAPTNRPWNTPVGIPSGSSRSWACNGLSWSITASGMGRPRSHVVLFAKPRRNLRLASFSEWASSCCAFTFIRINSESSPPLTWTIPLTRV
jgi:hypothetical protein